MANKILKLNATTSGDKIYIDSDNLFDVGSGIDVTNNIISNQFTTLANPNLNDIKYNYQGYVYGATNLPPGLTNSNGELNVFGQKNGNNIAQFYLPFNQQDRVYYRQYFNNAWGVWKLFANSYITGEVVTLTNWFECVGLIGINNNSVFFSIPLGKSIDTVYNVTFTSLKVIIKSVNGTVISTTELVNNSTYSLTYYIVKGINAISVRITGFSGLTTNTPCVVEIQSGTSFTFS